MTVEITEQDFYDMRNQRDEARKDAIRVEMKYANPVARIAELEKELADFRAAVVVDQAIDNERIAKLQKRLEFQKMSAIKELARRDACITILESDLDTIQPELTDAYAVIAKQAATIRELEITARAHLKMAQEQAGYVQILRSKMYTIQAVCDSPERINIRIIAKEALDATKPEVEK